MRRLSKEERTGATVIALVALVVCGGSVLLSRRQKLMPETENAVKTIILATDSTDNYNEETYDSGIKTNEKRSKNGKKTGTSKKERKKKGKSQKKKKKSNSPERDYLNDPL